MFFSREVGLYSSWGYIVSKSVFDWGCIRFWMRWGSIQADTVYDRRNIFSGLDIGYWSFQFKRVKKFETPFIFLAYIIKRECTFASHKQDRNAKWLFLFDYILYSVTGPNTKQPKTAIIPIFENSQFGTDIFKPLHTSIL